MIGIGGQVEADPSFSTLFDTVLASSPQGMPLEQALPQARQLLVEATVRALTGFRRATR